MRVVKDWNRLLSMSVFKRSFDNTFNNYIFILLQEAVLMQVLITEMAVSLEFISRCEIHHFFFYCIGMICFPFHGCVFVE